MSRSRKRQAEAVTQDDRTARHPIVWLAGLAAFAMLIMFGYVIERLSDPASLPIRKVTVEGNFRHLSPDHVRDLVSSAVDGGFFSVNVQRIRQRLLDEPWMHDASIRRIWPDTLRVSIREQNPVARWGEHALLNGQADLFAPDPKTMPRDLAILTGPVGTESEVLKYYRRLQPEFAQRGLKITRIDLSERHAWAIEVGGGTRIVIGRHAVAERIARFERGFDLGLHSNWENIGVVDLRYTNGFAVKERGVDAGNG